jgi:uncharacterized Zn finger protein (UPF0148 family)
MKCPRCRVENDTGARYCADWLERSCPSCGTPVTPGKKFCRSCGAALTTEPAGRFASPESYTPKHLAEKHERVVELAADSLAALPADRVYEHFGNVVPPSVYDRV